MEGASVPPPGNRPAQPVARPAGQLKDEAELTPEQQAIVASFSKQPHARAESSGPSYGMLKGFAVVAVLILVGGAVMAMTVGGSGSKTGDQTAAGDGVAPSGTVSFQMTGTATPYVAGAPNYLVATSDGRWYQLVDGGRGPAAAQIQQMKTSTNYSCSVVSPEPRTLPNLPTTEARITDCQPG